MTNLFKRFIQFVAPLMALLCVASVALADVDTCTVWNPLQQGQCLSWQPTLLPGAAWCNDSDNPDSGHVQVYSGTNYTGWCQSIPTPSGGNYWPDLRVYGWHNTTSAQAVYMHINSVKIGSGRTFISYDLNYGCSLGCGTWTTSQTNISAYDTDAIWAY